jgi:hypothetical protein
MGGRPDVVFRRSLRHTPIPSKEINSDIFDVPATRSWKVNGTSSMRLPRRWASWVVSIWKA